MKNPVTALDDFVLAQFQKITDKAAMQGYTKYDLAVGCQKVAGGLLFGSGIYQLLRGSITSSTEFLIGGSFVTIFGISEYYKVKGFRESEKRDLNYLLSGAIPVPEQHKVARMFWGAFSSFFVLPVAIYSFGGELYDSVKYPENNQQLNTLGLFDNSFYGIGCFLISSALYFLGTNMIPPKAKKLHQRIGDKIKTFFTPTPAQQPVTVPATAYQSIDHLMENNP